MVNETFRIISRDVFELIKFNLKIMVENLIIFVCLQSERRKKTTDELFS